MPAIHDLGEGAIDRIDRSADKSSFGHIRNGQFVQDEKSAYRDELEKHGQYAVREFEKQGIGAGREVTPESNPLAGGEKVSENKFGAAIYRMPDGAYKKVRNGEISDISEGTAQILIKNAPYVAEKSEAEKIRDAAQTEAERLKLAREKVATLGEETAKPLPEAGARVLRAQDEASRQWDEKQAEAELAETKRLAEEKAAADKKEAKANKAPEDIKAKKRGAAADQKLVAINDIAKDVANREEFLPKDDEKVATTDNKKEFTERAGARKRLQERAQKMVETAREAGYKFQKPLRDRVGETNHPNEGVLLHEAELFARKKVLKTEDVNRFTWAENELRNNGEAGRKAVMKARSESGRDWAAAGAAPTKEAGVEDVEASHAQTEAVERADEVHERELTNAQIAREKFLEAKNANEERLETERKAREKEQEELRKEAELAKRALPAEPEIISSCQRESDGRRSRRQDRGPSQTHPRE